jgi:hypothetical protein
MGREHVAECSGELVQLGEVGAGELPDEPVPFIGKANADDAGILDVVLAADDADGLRPVDQPDSAVALQQEVLSQVANGGRLGARVALDGHQQLVLSGGQADRGCLVLAPAQEPPQRHPELQVVLEILRARPNGTALLVRKLADSLVRARARSSAPGPSCRTIDCTSQGDIVPAIG